MILLPCLTAWYDSSFTNVSLDDDQWNHTLSKDEPCEVQVGMEPFDQYEHDSDAMEAELEVFLGYPLISSSGWILLPVFFRNVNNVIMTSMIELLPRSVSESAISETFSEGKRKFFIFFSFFKSVLLFVFFVTGGEAIEGDKLVDLLLLLVLLLFTDIDGKTSPEVDGSSEVKKDDQIYHSC